MRTRRVIVAALAGLGMTLVLHRIVYTRLIFMLLQTLDPNLEWILEAGTYWSWAGTIALTVVAIPGLLLSALLVWRRQRDGETRCRKCGYILRGIKEPRCSECGEPI